MKYLPPPHEPRIIDDTHQEFLGIIYEKKDNGYFVQGQKRLHRIVWQFFNGAIPAKCEIHHVDFDKAHNVIGNLQLMTKAEHTQLHMLARPFKKYICKICGKEFESRAVGKAYFCSQKCRNVSVHQKKKTKTCLLCGKTFSIEKSNPKVCCSRSCASRFKGKKWKCRT